MGSSRTTSTRARVPRTGVPLPTVAPTSITMVSSLRRFSQSLASQASTGTTLHLSTHSTWPPPNSGLAQFAVTVMPMPIPKLMTMPPDLPLHPMIVSGPKETRKRKNLQLALHAHACSLRCTLSAIRSGTRYAKWAGGSRSQTHRRAAMGGFTQDDGYVRGVAATHDCSSGSFSNFCNFWRLRPVLELSP
jgi:hypothetical protein